MDSELRQHEQRIEREMSERIYNAVATVLDAEYATRQNWGLSSLHDDAAGAAADAAMAVLTGRKPQGHPNFDSGNGSAVILRTKLKREEKS